MKSQVMSRFTEIWLPSTALIIFLSIFMIMLVYVWRKSANKTFDMAEQIPFDEGVKNERK